MAEQRKTRGQRTRQRGDHGQSLGPEHDRPRERLARLGPAALSEVELLAVIISSGSKKVPVLELSRKLISQFGSVAGVARATLAETFQSGTKSVSCCNPIVHYNDRLSGDLGCWVLSSVKL